MHEFKFGKLTSAFRETPPPKDQYTSRLFEYLNTFFMHFYLYLQFRYQRTVWGKQILHSVNRPRASWEAFGKDPTMFEHSHYISETKTPEKISTWFKKKKVSSIRFNFILSIWRLSPLEGHCHPHKSRSFPGRTEFPHMGRSLPGRKGGT